MKLSTTLALFVATSLVVAGCGKAKEPAQAAAVKVGEAAEKAGEAAKVGAAEASERAKKAAAAAKGVAEVAKAEALKTAKVAADGAEATAAAAKVAAEKTAAAAKIAAAGEAPAAGAATGAPADWTAVVKDPSKATATAPGVYKVKFSTTQGDFTMTVHREWAPKGADRFYNLVKAGYFTDIGFFRNIAGFMVQFGIHGEPTVNAAWRGARISDDPGKQSNKLGFVTFATSGKDSRTTQIFINYKDNSFLDRMGFSPFAIVDAEGMAVVNKLYKGYGEGAPRGKGPDQGRLQREGNKYLKAEFPKMDFCKSAVVLDGK
ncbi:MAG: peptidylprolyl isomerase [Myxococcales bacterium]|nr:peptidylprolyl isomerase [Myxococcales bacterium]